MNEKVLNIYKVILGCIIIIDVILITLTLILDIPASEYNKILIFDIGTCILLLFDFFYAFFRADDKKQYFKENWLELVASIPFDLILSTFMFLRYLRLIKVFRVIFLISEYFSIIGNFLKSTRLDEILAVFIVIIFGSTLGLYVLDPGMNNLFDNLWFVVVSITTVGYGDITPDTVSGKIVSLILLVIGVFIFSAITGAISTYFMDSMLKKGSYHIYDLGKKIDDLNEKSVKNEQKIDELKNEIKELKEIIEKEK